MNKQEYWQTINKYKDPIYKKVHDELQKWMIENNITVCCVVHHRDDTEETCDYNELHYERWGYEEDGTFTEGKYVQFMTRSEHNRYHSKHRSEDTLQKLSAAAKGEKNPMYGTHRAGEKNPMFGKHHTDASKEKNRQSHIGKMLGEENPSKRPEVRQKKSAKMQAAKFLYTAYKENGGEKKWNEFLKALKRGDITFETQPVSVFIDGGKPCYKCIYKLINGIYNW